MVGGVVLDQDDVPGERGEGPVQEGGIGFRVELTVESLEVEAAAEAVEEAEGAIGLADAAGLDRRLDPLEGPSGAQASPLGEARLVAEEDDGLLLPRDP